MIFSWKLVSLSRNFSFKLSHLFKLQFLTMHSFTQIHRTLFCFFLCFFSRLPIVLSAAANRYPARSVNACALQQSRCTEFVLLSSALYVVICFVFRLFVVPWRGTQCEWTFSLFLLLPRFCFHTIIFCLHLFLPSVLFFPSRLAWFVPAGFCAF